jgi:hypothetical protein
MSDSPEKTLVHPSDEIHLFPLAKKLYLLRFEALLLPTIYKNTAKIF